MVGNSFLVSDIGCAREVAVNCRTL